MKAKNLLCLLLAVAVSLLGLPAFAADTGALPDDAIVVDAAWQADALPRTTVFRGKTIPLVWEQNAFADLQAALDKAPEGGTILVLAGSYGTVTFHKSLTVLGALAGVDPNVRGAHELDDWTLSPEWAATPQTVVTENWNIGAQATDLTIDGITLQNCQIQTTETATSGSAKYTLNNILITGKTIPLYFTTKMDPYKPENNGMSRSLYVKNLRAERCTASRLMVSVLDHCELDGIYIDGDSTAKVVQGLSLNETDEPMTFTVRNSMFRSKTTQVLNLRLRDNETSDNNQNIGAKPKVTVTVENNRFIDNDTDAATNNIVALQWSTENVHFNITDNTFVQNEKVSDTLKAIHTLATGSFAMASRMTVKNNRAINIPVFYYDAKNSADPIDLNGNYYKMNGVVGKPQTEGNKTEINCTLDWWYTNYDLTTRSDAQEETDVSRLYDIDTELHWMGRTYREGETTYFNWTNAGFAFSFRGTGARAVIRSHNNYAGKATETDNIGYLKVYVDGAFYRTVKLDFTEETVTLAAGLPAGEHTVQVVKRTNARSSTAGLSRLWITDGEKLPAPRAACRRMLFIGDSITVGYASLGGSEWTTQYEDGTITYAALTADYFGAENHTVAISGRGVVYNTGGDQNNLAPVMMNWVDWNHHETWDASRYQPDVIVVNLGTNDESSAGTTGLTAETFITGKDGGKGLAAMLDDLRAQYPEAKIIYAYGFLRDGYESQIIEHIESRNDPNLCYLHLESCDASEKSVGHPNAAAHADRAQTLIAKVAELTGWTEGAGHFFEEKSEEPTCGKSGRTYKECTRCGLIADEQTVPATGKHTWDNGKVTVKATATKAGAMTYTCTVCHTTKTESIPKLQPTVDSTKQFKDVVKGKWYVGAINFAVENNLFEGMDSTHFAPDGNMTRAMFVTVLGRLAGAKVNHKAATKFSDVPAGKWYTGYVKWASDNKIVEGDQGKFSPDDNVTREQICKMMVEYCSFAGIELRSVNKPVTFKDQAKVSKWAKTYVSKAQTAGFIEGDNGYFNPLDNATRAQVATIFMRFVQNYNVL